LILELQNIGKKLNDRWLFKSVNLTMQTGQSLSITGRNGSGKSTLLQIIYGLTQATEGQVLLDGKSDFEPSKVMSATAPSMELPMDFSIRELHQLSFSLKKMDLSLEEFSDFAMFSNRELNRPVKHFSSGMLQRLKTAFCIQSGSPVILLDEPLTNMDVYGEKWYLNCQGLLKTRICIVAGNTPAEVAWTDRNLEITND
jgi:ABC-type multidrug transport system ATPase subunit